jgi:MFS family permease
MDFHSLDDAIENAGYGKFNFILIALSAFTLTCVMMETTAIGMVLPFITCEMNLNNSQKGFLGSVSFIGTIFVSHLWGFLADTKGRKKIIISSLVLSILFNIISSFSANFWCFAIFRFLNGCW